MLPSDCTAADAGGTNGSNDSCCSVVVVALPLFVTTPVFAAAPPLRIRRRLVLNGPGRFNDTVVMMSMNIEVFYSWIQR